MTWHVTTWVRDMKRWPLSADELSLIDGAIARIRIVLGLCECGAAPAAVGRRDRCEECWQRSR